MTLFLAELRKAWADRLFPLLLAVLAAANLLLLWLDTRPAGDAPSPAAVRAVADALDGLDMEQRGAFLHDALARAQALLQLKRYYQQLAWGGAYLRGWRAQHADLLAQYDEMYKNHDYTLYTANLETEVQLFESLTAEYDTVNGYAAFLEEVQRNAAQLAGISIFQREGYTLKSTARTAAQYAGLGGVSIEYWPQQGLMTALGAPFTDLLCLAAMLGLALGLVRRERDAGLLGLVRSAPGGRLHTALAKLAAFGVSLLAVLAVLYGVNLAWCAATWGLGPPGRTIQSVPALMRCTMQITVAQYLGRFLLAKWAAAFVMGLWVMLAALAARHALAAWAGALALPAAMAGVRAAIPATARLNVLKYANLWSLMQTNELLGAWRNLYWFGEPAPLPLVEWCAAAVYGAVFGGAFCLLFARAALPTAPPRGRGIARQRRTRAVGVFRAEAHKLLAVCGAGLCLAALAGLSVHQAMAQRAWPDGEEACRAAYLAPISGPWRAESRAWLLAQGEEFADLRRAQQQVSAGLLPAGAVDIYGAQAFRYSVYQQVVAQLGARLSARPGAWVVYDSGWRALLGLDGAAADTRAALLAGLACAVCFSGLFALERRTGMEALLLTTPRGRAHTARAKLGLAAAVAVAIAALTELPALWGAVRDYGLPAPLAPAMSLDDFAALPAVFTLGGVWLLRFLCRAAACLCMGAATLWLGRRLGGAMPALFAGAAAWCLPALLALAGMDNGIEWLGPTPWFRAAALLPTAPLVPPLLLAAALLIAAAVAQSLYAAYEWAGRI